MNRSDRRIEGGYILYPRHFLERLADAPLLDRALWIWLLCGASHADRSEEPGALARGQLVTTLHDLIRVLRWHHGYVLKQPSKSTVRRALERLAERRLIDTRRTTRGIVVTIRDYDRYQDPASYVRRMSGTPLDTTCTARAAPDRQEGKEGRKERGTSSSFSRHLQTFDQMREEDAREAFRQVRAKVVGNESK